MRARALVLVGAFVVAACSSSSTPAPDPTAAVVHQYATNLDLNYKDAITQLVALKGAVDAFVMAPTQDGLVACQNAWLAARPWYGQSEISRFYGGPLDQAQGDMNEWPIDERFIDYSPDTPMGGIINDPKDYPQITAQVLASADEQGSSENLSTGFHAVEFLLWGERPDQTQGPGTRPYTDFVDGGTAANQDRRRTYLQVVTSMLLDAMRGVDAQWDLTNSSSYGTQFVASTQTGFIDIFRGFTQMAVSELFYERLDDPYVSQNRKDEESCFSESTIIDLNANALGVENVYLGRYVTMDGTTVQGPSISDLVKAKDASLDMQVRQQLAAVRAAIAAIPPPFDHAVLAPASSPEHMAVQTAVDAFAPLQDQLDHVATTLGIVNNL